MNEEALQLIGQLYVEKTRLQKVAQQLQDALKLKTRELAELQEVRAGVKNEPDEKG